MYGAYICSAPRRAWHAVVRPIDRFNWLLGLRVATVFVGPMIVAHLGYVSLRDATIVALAGMLIALVASAIPPGPTRVPVGLALIAVLPLVSATQHVVEPHSVPGVALMALGGLVASLAVVVSRTAAVFARTAGIGLLVSAALPATARTAWLLLLGGAIALVVVLVTQLLLHPRLALPDLPTSRPPAPERGDLIRHAFRLAATLFAAGAVAEWIGADSEFAAHSSWMLIGIWIAMQPHAAATRDTALQRSAGTVLGGLLTVALGFVPHGLWLGWLFLVLAFVAFGLRTVNYAWYCVGLTPIIVLGFAGTDLSTELLVARIVWTAVGVGVAFLARVLLWPGDVDQPSLAAAA